MLQALYNPISGKFGGRLKAWWNGDEITKGQPDPGRGERSRTANDVRDFPSPSGVAEWTPQRIASIQCLYGEGVDGPSGRERARNLINPIGLNRAYPVVTHTHYI